MGKGREGLGASVYNQRIIIGDLTNKRHEMSQSDTYFHRCL